MDKADLRAIADKYMDSVYRIAVNYCKNADDAADAVQNAFLKTDDIEENPACEIWNAVTRLPAKYSIILHLHYHEGYTVEEIAEILKLTPSNVLVRLHRGRNKLKEVLAKGGFYE